MADDLTGLFRLTEAQVKPAAEVLARAFQNYPINVYLIPDEAKRRTKQPTVFRRLVRTGIKVGEVYATSPQMEGVAIWLPSDRRPESFIDRLISGRLLLPWLSGRAAMARQRAFMEYSAAMRQMHVPFRHWYLQMIGVDPVYQGKGYAGKLLKPMLARADKEGVPCFLETHLERNVTLYEHYGFRVAEKGVIPGSNVRSWAMVRG
jgi:GNAT superfamily N-acetyltransferase